MINLHEIFATCAIIKWCW